MPRKAKNTPANETPEQRFVRMANDTVNVVLKKCISLGNLRGSKYKSTKEQHAKIKSALSDGLNRAMDKLSLPADATSNDLFKL